MDQKIVYGQFFQITWRREKQNGSPNHVPHGAPFLWEKRGATSLRKKSNINPKSHLPLRSKFSNVWEKNTKVHFAQIKHFLYHLESSHNLYIENDLAFSIWSHIFFKIMTKIKPLVFFSQTFRKLFPWTI